LGGNVQSFTIDYRLDKHVQVEAEIVVKYMRIYLFPKVRMSPKYTPFFLVSYRMLKLCYLNSITLFKTQKKTQK